MVGTILNYLLVFNTCCNKASFPPAFFLKETPQAGISL